MGSIIRGTAAVEVVDANGDGVVGGFDDTGSITDLDNTVEEGNNGVEREGKVDGVVVGKTEGGPLEVGGLTVREVVPESIVDVMMVLGLALGPERGIVLSPSDILDVTPGAPIAVGPALGPKLGVELVLGSWLGAMVALGAELVLGDWLGVMVTLGAELVLGDWLGAMVTLGAELVLGGWLGAMVTLGLALKLGVWLGPVLLGLLMVLDETVEGAAVAATIGPLVRAVDGTDVSIFAIVKEGINLINPNGSNG